MASTSHTHIAVLVRGNCYFFKDIRFDREVPVPVTAEIAAGLMELYNEVPDADGEVVHKRIFKVKPLPATATAQDAAVEDDGDPDGVEGDVAAPVAEPPPAPVAKPTNRRGGVRVRG